MTGPRDIQISEGYNCNLEIYRQFVLRLAFGIELDKCVVQMKNA
ncbi:hypothetical protein OROMI_018989 [Orobanche minor]